MRKIIILFCGFWIVSFCFADSKEFSGFVHFRFSSGENENDSFLIKRARLKYLRKIDEKFSYKLQIDVLKEPALLDAVLEYKYSNLFKLIIGQFKIPISAEALTPAIKQDLIEKYLFITQIFPSCCRDIGVMAKGVFKKIRYLAGVFNGNGMNKPNNDDRYLYVLRFEREFFSLLKTGISFAYSHEIFGKTVNFAPYKKRVLQGDFEFKRKNVFLKFEGIICCYLPDDPKITSIEAQSFGITGGLFLIPQKLQIVTRFEKYDPNKS
ncbi:MAG: hypothetical protein DRI36_05330, partial [Caldiserica bacterium]